MIGIILLSSMHGPINFRYKVAVVLIKIKKKNEYILLGNNQCYIKIT